MDANLQNATGGIGYNVMFPALNFLKPVKAGFRGGFGGAFDALAVDDPRTRFRVTTVFFRTRRRTSAFTRSKKPFAIHFI